MVMLNNSGCRKNIVKKLSMLFLKKDKAINQLKKISEIFIHFQIVQKGKISLKCASEINKTWQVNQMGAIMPFFAK